MDRNRHAHEIYRPVIVKRKRGRPVVKKAEPELVDPEENPVWITYDTEEPDMVMLQPMMRIGAVMVNPTKAGSFHVRLATAEKIVARLGPQYAIEGKVIVRRLAFVFENHFDPIDTIQQQLRTFLLNIPDASVKGVLGISIHPEGKLPVERANGWVYFTVPQKSTCKNKTGTFLKKSHTPEAVGPGGELKRGIFDDSGALEFATYGGRVVNVRMYVSDVPSMCRVIYTAIKNGTQFALEYVAKDITMDEFLAAELKSMNDSRKADMKKAEESLEAQKAATQVAIATLRASQEKHEKAERELLLVSKKLTLASLVKEYPALASVAGVNDDDPSVTVVNTKDIVINGVNLGAFKVKINPGLAAVQITNKRTPPNLTHPRLAKLDGKWKWDIDPAIHDDLLTSLSMGRIARATNIVLTTLLTIDEKNPDHPKRLEEIDKFMNPQVKELVA